MDVWLWALTFLPQFNFLWQQKEHPFKITTFSGNCHVICGQAMHMCHFLWHRPRNWEGLAGPIAMWVFLLASEILLYYCCI